MAAHDSPGNHRVIALFSALAVALALGGCAANRSAPVIERAVAKKPAIRHKVSDWRPETYTVEKGDTLYGIAFDHGLDYRDLAEWNDIGAPYVIKVGQQLRLRQPGSGVVTTPLRQAPTPQIAGAADASLLKTGPKATKQAYAESAPGKTPQIEGQAQAVAKKASTKQASPEQRGDTALVVEDENDLDWGWPTQGKVVAGFKEGTASKGLDIAGKAGQAVYAAAPGKVVYSGSGLRGYGKLVIIKHNKMYLSAYAHNSQILVKEGQSVAKGQKIAEMGNTDTDQVKLHFEVRRLGKPVDPMKYLPGEPAS